MTGEANGTLWLGSVFPVRCLVLMADSEMPVSQVGKMVGGVKWRPQCHPIAKSVLPPECSVGDTRCRPSVPFFLFFYREIDGGRVTEPEAWMVQDKPWDPRPLLVTPVLGC